MYASLWRHFRTSDHVGELFVANEILQGCPLSVMLINLLTSVWADTMCLKALLCVLKGYTDDIGVYTTANQEFLCQGVDVMSSLLIGLGYNRLSSLAASSAVVLTTDHRPPTIMSRSRGSGFKSAALTSQQYSTRSASSAPLRLAGMPT